jgi:hypothetical protein
MDLRSEPNPYQSPVAETAPPQAAVEGASKRIYLAWSAVFFFNLGVPLLFGWGATEKGGRIGMFAAAFVMLVVGCWLCASAQRFARALIVGGVAIGLAQILPLLQILAGGVAFRLVEVSGLEGPAPDLQGLTSEASGFVVTMTTGALLMAAALMVGLAIRALFSARWRH